MELSSKDEFSILFEAVCEKCFGKVSNTPLNETESKKLSHEIEEHTGLVIGWKSLKNYSLAIFGSYPQKKENPSISTLDTLARYFYDAPQTDELSRRRDESHYPYWFKYRASHIPEKLILPPPTIRTPNYLFSVMGGVLVGVMVLGFFFVSFWEEKVDTFEDDFEDVSERSLQKKGWVLKEKLDSLWHKNASKKQHLTLYTLKGDNILSNADDLLKIRNLMIRPLSSEDFSVELYLSGFVPTQNWQQTGVILLEDSTFNSKNLRVSIVYNDFFGGYKKNPEINIQIVAQLTKQPTKPEEIAQVPIFSVASKTDSLVTQNLRKSAIRIEKRGNLFRFLFTSGQKKLFAFKEIESKEMPITPRYIAIYASSGNTSNPSIIPVYIDRVSISAL